MGQMLDVPHDADLPLEVLLLGLNEVAVRRVLLDVDAAHVALQRGVPGIRPAHQGQPVLLAVEESPLPGRQIARLDELGERVGGVEVEGLARRAVPALVVPLG